MAVEFNVLIVTCLISILSIKSKNWLMFPDRVLTRIVIIIVIFERRLKLKFFGFIYDNILYNDNIFKSYYFHIIIITILLRYYYFVFLLF